MKDFFVNILRNLFILSDYIFWLIFDLSKFKLIDKQKIKKVLFIHSGAIGELLVSTPAVKAVHKQLNAEVHYLVGKGRDNILLGNTNISKIYTMGTFIENLGLMRREKYDAVVILWPSSLNISFAALLAGIKYRVGCFKMVKEGPAFFYTRRWWPFKLVKQHAVQSNLDMIRMLGIDNQTPKIEFYYSKKEAYKIKYLLKKEKIKKFAVIHAGFGGVNKFKSYSRKWPETFYSALADKLIEAGYSIIFTGLSEEKDTAEKIISFITKKNKAYLYTGKLSLKELGALVKNSSLVIAPDTSIIHIASSFDIPVIDLMGSNFIEWHPWMKKTNYITINHPYCDKIDPKNYFLSFENKKKKAIKYISDNF